MGFSLSTDSYKAYADRNATSFSGYSSVSENFAASVGQVIDEELSISSLLHNEGFSSRNQQIRNMASDGKIDQEVMDMYTTGNPGRGKKVDYNAIAEYLNWSDSLPEKLLTDKELTDERNEELANRRKYRSEVYNTSLTGGKVAQFAGGIVASGLDPVNMVTMTLAAPIAGVRNVSKAMYSLKMARNGAALNAGVSIPIEPFIHSWKEEIGAEYTIEDSLFNIVASGVLGGTVSGIGAAIGKSIGKDIDPLISKIRAPDLENKSYDNMVTEFKRAGADEDDAENLARFIDEANQAANFTKKTPEIVIMESVTDDLPKVKSGTTRLYRAESPTIGFKDVFDAKKIELVNVEGLPGKHYTSDKDYADYYRETYGKDAKLHYIDIPTSYADKIKVKEGEFILDIADLESINIELNAEDFVRKTEESQSGMDAGNKADIEPNFDSEDAAVLKTQFDKPEVAEGEVQLDTREHVPADNMMIMDDGTRISFRDASNKIDEETEFLISKLDCLNG